MTCNIQKNDLSANVISNWFYSLLIVHNIIVNKKVVVAWFSSLLVSLIEPNSLAWP